MTTQLKTTLTRLVELSRTNINAAEYLYETLRETTDRNDQMQIRNAIRHAERNAAAL